MDRKQHFIFFGAVMILAILACQSIARPIPGPQVVSTETAQVPIPIFGSEEDMLTLPFNFLADPNTACAIYKGSALSCLDRDGWHVYKWDSLESISQCPDGRIYLGIVNKVEYGSYVKVYVLADKTLFKEVGHDRSQIFGVDDFACGPGNEIWVSNYWPVSIFGHFDGTTWTYHYLGSSIYSGFGNLAIAIAPNGNLWAAIPGNSVHGKAGGVATFDGTDWQVIRQLSCEWLSDGRYGGFYSCPGFSGLVMDADGNVWVSSSDGLEKYDGVEWSTFSAPEGLGGRVMFTKENKVWMASQEAISTFDPRTNSWVLEFGLEALRGRSVNSMQFDRQGRLWVATDYGLYIYDGYVWTTYHTYTADLYANSADEIVIFGDGPQLPVLASKAPGSVHGKVSTAYANMQAEICLKQFTNPVRFSDATPCADQAYHALTTVDADGSFTFTDIPVGRYYLLIQQDEKTWSSIGSNYIPEGFEVNPGAVTELGEIVFPPD